MTASAAEAALWSIPVASAIISMVSLVYAAIGVRRSADAAHVDHLESELGTVNKRLEACENDRERLQGEITRLGQREIQLMRLVVNLETRQGS